MPKLEVKSNLVGTGRCLDCWRPCNVIQEDDETLSSDCCFFPVDSFVRGAELLAAEPEKGDRK